MAVVIDSSHELIEEYEQALVARKILVKIYCCRGSTKMKTASAAKEMSVLACRECCYRDKNETSQEIY